MAKLEAQPRLTSVASDVIEWARRVVGAVNPLVDSDATQAGQIAALQTSDAAKAPINNPVFTGNPQAPTPLATDNSVSIITSAWAKLGFVASLGLVGYFKFPNWMGGLIVQWGTTVQTLNGSGGGSVVLPLAFPGAFFTAVICNGDSSATTISPVVNGTFVTSFGLIFPGAGAIATRTNWIAAGN